MGDIVTAVSGAIGLTKQLLELASVAKDAKAKGVLADLQLQLAEIKSKLADVTGENAELKRANAELRSELGKIKADVPPVELRDGLYYKSGIDQPYCTTCYDRDRKLILLAKNPPPFDDLGNWKCNACRSFYHGKLA